MEPYGTNGLALELDLSYCHHAMDHGLLNTRPGSSYTPLVPLGVTFSPSHFGSIFQEGSAPSGKILLLSAFR